ncbi:uncharacterized protein LOC113761489 [Coffea eugenioides]|uniref:uncharacterized protein LOC113761489 n=1 Tax=Coffea eugenioides TaxID=49369 RepID=UPI000F605899|nr:uncharacterized protein LOC113761489 [Coffea eugenioides]
MISVMMSSSSNNPFESDRKNDPGEEAKPRVLVPGDEKVNFGLNLNSIVSGEDGMSRASMHVDENARVGGGGGGVSLVVDYKVSEEGRVSGGVDEVSEFRVCELKNVDEDLKNVSGSGFSEVGSEMKKMQQFDSGGGVDVKVELVRKEIDDKRDGGNGNFEAKDQRWSGSGADYDSMLSMFDQYAANGKSEAVGYGYEIGDMVWGKVKSHPWWPGHIFNEAFASASVRRTKREGHVLVAFFGDSSYGWFDPAELIPFEPNLADKSRQMNSRTFTKSVEEAVDEVNRRQGLGLACKCRNQFNFRKTNVEGYFAVDVCDYETGFYSASQIKKARDSFQPGGTLNFVKQLALTPMGDDFGSINFIKNRATVSAYRKAAFEEFDETYAQAFGAQPVRPAPRKAPPEPSRVPLSGRLVIAEALGKGKTSLKSNKSKDQLEKDKYLFKRREEPNEFKTHIISRGQGGSSSLPSQGVGSVHLLEGMHSSVVDQAGQTSVSRVTGGFEQSASQPAGVEQFRGQEHTHNSVGGNFLSDINDIKPVAQGSKLQTDSGTKKGKHHKRPVGEVNSEKSGSVEKIKKRKKEGSRENSSHNVVIPGINVKEAAFAGKVIGKPAEKFSGRGDDSQVKHLGNDDAVKGSLLPDLGTKPSMVNNDTQLELPRLLDDLRALALNPFYGAERSCHAIVRQVILRFRSLVYQKSLSSLVPGENESKDAHGITPSPVSSDNLPDNLRERSSVKPPKAPTRLDDPTKGGRKRAPSDRQEELTLKKKKKINDLKLLTTEKKAAHKAPEAQRGDPKDTSTKTVAQAPEKKAAQKPPEVQVGDGREIPRKTMPLAPGKVSRLDPAKTRGLPARAADPTMLVMKFPAGATLPSSAELRAKFARFGPLDHSGTRIFWKSSTIRLVYHHKIDAQAALRFATSGATLFGNSNVRCHLRDVEAPETDSTKVQEDPYPGISQSRDSPVLQQRLAAAGVSQPVQLKSCLKKPSGDDGASTGGGNGTVRGRVKFMLGDEGSVRTSSDDAATSHGLNYNSEKIHTVIPPPPPPPSILPVAPNKFHHTELVPRNVQSFSMPAVQPMPTHIDISQQMISLLAKCKDVVNNVTGTLGYVPYHPL